MSSRLFPAVRSTQFVGLALLSALAPVARAAETHRSPAAPPTAIRLVVDARDIAHKVLHAHETIPVAPGPLRLAYPKWIPGEHGPTGPLADLAGVRLAVGGRPLAWRRDPLDMFTLQCAVPADARALDVELDYLLPSSGNYSEGRSASDRLAVLSWNAVVLYPVGRPVDTLSVAASVQLPAGWKHATVLPEETLGETRGDDIVAFRPVSLSRLVDSPLLMAAHLAEFQLAAMTAGHALAVAADAPEDLALKPEWQAGLGRLADEAEALFGVRHYERYLWLVSLSRHVAHFGLEHHECSDDRLDERTLLEDWGRRDLGGLLAHEYVHSWNGKWRRPADLITPDFQAPQKTELLWVYEGLTTYLGGLLATRAGLWTPDEYREHLAANAARLDREPGRSWRSLADTAVAAQVLYDAPPDAASWRRGVDFYPESILIWLEADTLIRQVSGGQRSLDDFCRAFFGGPGAPYTVRGYTRADVIATLRSLANYDWEGFLAQRLETTSTGAPVGGIEGAGWKLAFTGAPNVDIGDTEREENQLDEVGSIGLLLRPDGTVIDAVRGTPAGSAGLAPGMRLIAVGGRRFSPEVLRAALAATKGGKPSLELIVENDEFFRTLTLEYGGGRRYPHLARDASRPDLLERILAPRAR